MITSNNGTASSYITTNNNAVISLADCVSTSNVDKIRELELRVKVLENHIKAMEHFQDSKYKIIYGE